MFRSVCVRGSLVVLAFAVCCAAGMAQQTPSPSPTGSRWQASATPSVVMAVRRTSPPEPYVADFALTSPAGETRHTTVSGKAGAYATVSFGEIDTPGGTVWGAPDAGFSLSTKGLWSWTCTVAGREVARGSFMLSRKSDGHVAIETTPPDFP